MQPFLGVVGICLLLAHSAAYAIPAPNCASLLTKTKQPGLAKAYSIKIRMQNVEYRISAAMRFPSHQESEIVLQILWAHGLRDIQVEQFIFSRLQSIFKVSAWENHGSFIRGMTSPFHRDDFKEATQAFELQAKNRFSSVSTIYTEVTQRARTYSPEVADAAQMMTGYLRRQKAVDSQEEADRILNRAHTALMKVITERELRFFDYQIFNEVLSFEKDQAMQDIALKTAGLVPEADLDYQKIHDDIRAKFLKFAKEIASEQKNRAISYTEETRQMLEMISHLGDEALKIHAEISFLRVPLPFSENEFKYLKTVIHEAKPFDLLQIEIIMKALTAAKIQIIPKEYEFDKKMRAYIERSLLLDKLKRKIRLNLAYLEADLLETQSNKGPGDTDLRQRMYAKSVVVIPANGSTLDVTPNDYGYMPSSFLNQSRRLNSGNGNRKERLDYDTPEFD